MTEPLTIAETAARLGLSSSGVRKLVARSRRASKGETVKGQTIRFRQDGRGGPIRFHPEWVQDYIDRTTIDNETPRETRGKSHLDWSDLDRLARFQEV